MGIYSKLIWQSDQRNTTTYSRCLNSIFCHHIEEIPIIAHKQHTSVGMLPSIIYHVAITISVTKIIMII